jgi:hypothetical protein
VIGYYLTIHHSSFYHGWCGFKSSRHRAADRRFIYQLAASGPVEDITQLRSHTQPTDGTIPKVSKTKTPRIYSCDVCHSKHLPPMGAKCPFGPPSTEEGHQAQAVGGEVNMNMETLNKIASALNTVTTRLDSIESRLDNGGGSDSVIQPPVIPPVRRAVTLTPTIAELKESSHRKRNN